MTCRNFLSSVLLTVLISGLFVGKGYCLTSDCADVATLVSAVGNSDSGVAENPGRSSDGSIPEQAATDDENQARNLAEVAGMVAAHRSLNLPLVADPDSAENKGILQHMLFEVFSEPEGRVAEVGSIVSPAEEPDAVFPDAGGTVIPGTLEGDFSVDNKGTANYTLTLPVPSGVNYLGPSLALCYSSESGSGETGTGWSVSTGYTSSIVRGRSFPSRHGYVRGICFDEKDHFYLGGKLMVCVAGTQGRPGSAYRTEVDSFVTIAAAGSSGLIDSFVVTDKNGRKNTFGRLGDAVDALEYGERLDPELPEIAYAFHLKRVEDLYGNFIEYGYSSPNPGETLLSTVTYGSASDSPTGRFAIHFVYSPCEGSTWLYCQRRFQSRHRLDRINVTQVADGALLATYDLAYREDEDSGQTLLIAVRKSAWNGRELQSLRPTTFCWSAYAEKNVEKEIDDPADRSPREKDTKAGSADASSSAQPPVTCAFGDFNGDGKQDFLFFRGTRLVVRLSNGEGFDKESDWGDSRVGPSHLFEVCDINGDGLRDIVFGMSRKEKWAGSRGALYAMISNGSGFTGLDGTAAPKMIWKAGEEGMDPVAKDEKPGNSHRQEKTLIDKLDREGFLRRINIGDFNGDGRSDILIHRYDGRLSVRYSRGDCYGPVVTSPEPMGGSASVQLTAKSKYKGSERRSICPIVEDENGDGMDDYKWGELADEEKSPGVPSDLVVDLWFSALSKGDSFTGAEPIPPPGSPEDYPPILPSEQGSTVFYDLDLNGDGMTDSVEYTGRYSKNPVLKKLCLNTGVKADLLIGITDGNGIQTEIRYKPISDPSVYTPGATDNPSTAAVEGVSYPIRELRSTRYVVSGVYQDECNDTGDVSHFGNFGDPVYDSDGNKVRQVYAIRYHYSGARTDFSGRGFLGFHSFLTLDCQTNLVKYQFLTQAFPMTGLAAREQTYYALAAERDPAGRVTSLDLGLLSSKDNTVTFDMVKDPVTGTRWGTLFPFMSYSIEKRFEYSTSPQFPSVCAKKPLFGHKLPSGAHSRISAIVWFDEQDFPASSKKLPPPPEAVPVAEESPPHECMSRPEAAIITDWLGKYRLDASCRLTYGNIHRTLLTYADGNRVDEISEFWAPCAENGGLTGLVKRKQKIVCAPHYPAWTGGPVSCYTYTKTGDVATKTVDCASTDTSAHFIAVGMPNPLLTTTLTYEYSDTGLLRQTLLTGATEGDYDIGGSHVISKITAWDPSGRYAAKEENALGHVSTGKWDAWGNKTEETDCNGRHYVVEHDIAGRTTRTSNTLTGWYETTDYGFSDKEDNTHTVALPPNAPDNWLCLTSSFYRRDVNCWGDSETTYFDRKWRKICTINEEDGKSTMTDTIYLRDGYVAAQSEPYVPGEAIRWTVTEYDEVGRVAKVVAPDGSATINTYAGLVSIVEKRAPGKAKGATTVQLNNAKGNVIGTWNPGNAPESWTTTSVAGKASEIVKYDGFDLPRESSFLTGSFLRGRTVCTAKYDTLGKQTNLFIPRLGRTTRVFDALGRLRRKIDPDGTVTVTTYDVMNRAIRETVKKPGVPEIETTDWYYYDTVDDEGKHLVASGEGGWIGSLQRETSTTTGQDGEPTGPVKTTLYTYDKYGRQVQQDPSEGKETK
ncbi:MAG: VCBS repeat-containing protein [Opitutales bacterium]|nr:VCBS repeat-containing protein [Opitutales bacterium]